MPLINNETHQTMQIFSNFEHFSSRRNPNHKYRGIYCKLRVKAKVTNDKWHLKQLIIKYLSVILSLEIFLKSALTSVNVNIRGKE